MIKETREKYLKIFFWHVASIVFFLTCLFIGYGNFLLLYEKKDTVKNETTAVPGGIKKFEINLTEITDDLDIYNDPLQEIVDLIAYILMPYVIPILFYLPDLILILVAYIGITMYSYTPNPISNLGKRLGDVSQRTREIYENSKRLIQIQREAHMWLPAISWAVYLTVAVIYNIRYVYIDGDDKISRFKSGFLYESVRFSGLVSIFWASLILTAIFESLVDAFPILLKWFKLSRDKVKPFKVSTVVIWVGGVIAYGGSKLRRWISIEWNDNEVTAFILFGGLAFICFLWILLPMIYHLLEKMGIELEPFATLFGLKDIPATDLKEDIEAIESVLHGHMNVATTTRSPLDGHDIHETQQNSQVNNGRIADTGKRQETHPNSLDSIAHFYSESVYI